MVFLAVGGVALALGLRGLEGPPQPITSDRSAVSAPAQESASPPPIATTNRSTSAAPDRTPSGSSVRQPPPAFGEFLAASAPVTLDISSVGIHSTNFVDLHIAKDGTIEVPGSAREVGFYAPGPTPGQLGPAVLAAHVDSTEGPGIFYSLGAVKPGASITITRLDRSVTTFVVDKVGVYPKNAFPTDEVYRGNFTQSQIRLVTCGGTFDKIKHYLDNVIVFGHLASIS